LLLGKRISGDGCDTRRDDATDDDDDDRCNQTIELETQFVDIDVSAVDDRAGAGADAVAATRGISDRERFRDKYVTSEIINL